MADACKYDYLVIGGGSGGMASARRAAGYGAKVALIESARLGGTCVNVGCVPKKVMWNTAEVWETIHRAKHFGISTGEASFNWALLKQWRDAYVTRLNGIYGRNLAGSNVDIIEGVGKFVGPKTVEVGGNLYTADHILIAVGGRPSYPSYPGIEHTINSDGFFELEQQPQKVAVMGAGYIAVEMAGIFNALGTETHLFVRQQCALRNFDGMISEKLDFEMKRQGMKVHNFSVVKEIQKDEATGKLALLLENDELHEGFDTVLCAIGRVPNVEPLNLPAAGLETRNNGYIIADEYQNTNVEGIYALGDVCGQIELTPMAIAAGRCLADRLFNGMDVKADYENVPTVVFSHPCIGTCGLTEQQAREKFGEEDLKIYNSTFTNLYYGQWQIDPNDKPKTYMKLICQGPNELVVGIHILGMGADEMLQGFGVAMKMGATKADLDSCVAIHPTAAEELVTMAPWGMSRVRK